MRPCFCLGVGLGVWSILAGDADQSRAAGPEVREVRLVNPSFESAALHEGWSLHVYGAQPTLALDPAVRHEGKQSLRVSAVELSDTAFGQEVNLRAGRLYRLTGWVKTQHLDPHGSPVYGTFQVQHPGGAGTLASARNHGGNTDWTQETILFRAPPIPPACGGSEGGRTRLYKTPTYYAQQLYAHHAGTRPLQVEIEGDLERNDVSATLSRDGRTVALFVVNPTRDPRPITLDFSAFHPLEQTASVWTLLDTQRARERDVSNSFDDPERVRPVASSLLVRAAKFDFAFPPLSLTVLKLQVER